MRISKPLKGLCLLLIIGGIAYGAIYPVVQIYTEELSNSFWAGIIAASFALFLSIFSGIGGHLADKFGRKILIISGIFCISIAAFLFTLKADKFYFAIFYSLAGMGIGLVLPSSIAYVYDITDHENLGKSMSLFITSVIIGFTIGMPLSGILAKYISENAPFYFCSILALITTFLSLFLLEKEHYEKEKLKLFEMKDTIKNLSSIFKKKGMSSLIFRGFSSFFMTGILFTVLPIFLDNINDNIEFVGIVLLVLGIGMFIATPIGGLLADKIGRKEPIIISGILIAISLFILPFAESFLQAAIILIMTGIGIGINNPSSTALISEISPVGKKAGGLGFYGAISGIGLIIGPLCGGFLFDLSRYYPFFLASFMSIVSAIVIAIFVPETLKKS